MTNFTKDAQKSNNQQA